MLLAADAVAFGCLSDACEDDGPATPALKSSSCCSFTARSWLHHKQQSDGHKSTQHVTGPPQKSRLATCACNYSHSNSHHILLVSKSIWLFEYSSSTVRTSRRQTDGMQDRCNLVTVLSLLICCCEASNQNNSEWWVYHTWHVQWHVKSELTEFISQRCLKTICLQCFDAVGWVAGRASGL